MITKCEVCGESLHTVYRLSYEDIVGMQKGTYCQNIGVCSNCGLIITQNPFSEEALTDRYTDLSKFEYDDKDYYLGESDEYIKRSVKQKNFIWSNIDGCNSVLEVGASSGFNLSRYQQDGCRCYGIEPSKKNCELAKKNYNVNMFNGTFAQYMKVGENKRYDLIILSMVLEHIVNPYHFILELENINNKYIFIEVPTFDVKDISEPMGMFCEEHVNYFTLQSLYNLMRAAGYSLVDANIVLGIQERLPAGWPAIDTLWEKQTNDSQLNMCFNSVDLLKQYISVNEKILEIVKNKIAKIPNDERIAIWGTGHHISMLLANSDLKDKNIIYFYDSDKRKYTWPMVGREIKAFDEADIKERKIDSILIGSYIYQDEIYKNICKYVGECKIYKLYD